MDFTTATGNNVRLLQLLIGRHLQIFSRLHIRRVKATSEFLWHYREQVYFVVH